MAASRTIHIPGRDGRLEILWDRLGIPHVFAASQADAFRGMGYVEGYERLWQIHLSCLYANGNAAATMGARFVTQDVVHQAFDVPTDRVGIPASPGDWVVDAYLDGLNAYVDELNERREVPPEFAGIDARPRRFTRADIAARYRFTSWFQHRSWPEKLLLGKSMSRYGIDKFEPWIKGMTPRDRQEIERLGEALRNFELETVGMLIPEANFSGSNNWAVMGRRSASGKPMLATDPHQPHSIPNTFFYVHLNAGDWDVFGASFPGVPYFMMGYTRDLAWGLTTGMIDTYDVYVEAVNGDRVRTQDGWQPLEQRQLTIDVKDEAPREFTVDYCPHGPLIEPLAEQLGFKTSNSGPHRTAIRWSLQTNPTSAGVLAGLPLATDADAFGESLFEDDVSPLVNNIICVDRHDGLRRYIAATLPARDNTSGAVPLAGWDADNDYPQSRAAELMVEADPECGYAVTANDDTLGDRAPYPIHTFSAGPSRRDRIRELLDGKAIFTVDDFTAMQMDLTDLRARELVPELVHVLADSTAPDLVTARTMLADWDYRASVDSAPAAVYYAFLDRAWNRQLLLELGDEYRAFPVIAPAISKVEPHFYQGAAWRDLGDRPAEIIREAFLTTMAGLRAELGDDPTTWRFGALQQIAFWHSQRKREPFREMHVGPDPLGGSGTTLAMAMHLASPFGKERPGDQPAQRVFHGPAFRLVVDLADPDHCRFVIAAGNSGRPGSAHVDDHYRTWLAGDHFTVTLVRDEIEVESEWRGD